MIKKKVSIIFLLAILLLLLIPTVALAHNGINHLPPPTIEWCNTTENYNLWLYWYNLDHCPERVDPYKTWRWFIMFGSLFGLVNIAGLVWTFKPKDSDLMNE